MAENLTVIAFAVCVGFGLMLFGGLPGFIARKRGHPQWAPICVCGYCGILFFPAWIAAVVWALMSSSPKA